VTADRDRYRTLTAAAVLLVAAIAAVVSFVHIESLAMRYGQPAIAAWLLPVSIDGTVAVSSLAMLRAARLNLTAPWVACWDRIHGRKCRRRRAGQVRWSRLPGALPLPTALPGARCVISRNPYRVAEGCRRVRSPQVAVFAEAEL
jgi:hypothetical protein